jgi:hypothetical protein
LWRRLSGIRYLVAGRLAALAQGLAVRPLGADLVIADADAGAVTEAMSRVSASRWNERHQDFTGYGVDLGEAGPRRWRLRDRLELRIDVVPVLPAALTLWPAGAADTGGRCLRVVPLAVLLRQDPDVAELAARLQGRANQSAASSP